MLYVIIFYMSSYFIAVFLFLNYPLRWCARFFIESNANFYNFFAFNSYKGIFPLLKRRSIVAVKSCIHIAPALKASLISWTVYESLPFTFSR